MGKKKVARSLPIAFVVDDELEYPMPVRGTEGCRVGARVSRVSSKSGADMRVKHGKLELDVGAARARLPARSFGIVF